MDVTPENFKKVMSRFVTGITIVTCGNKEEPHGLTVNSFNSVSLEPSLILFSIRNNSSSLPVIEKTGKFVVNILSNEQEHLSNFFASKLSNRKEILKDHFTIDGVPFIKEALGHVICQVENIFPGGDHKIIVGKVEKLNYQENLAPLIYYSGKYRSLND